MRQTGFSLVELLVSLATGLFLIAGVLGIFTSTLHSQSETLKMTRLNQELRRVADLVSRDVKRAGYWSLASDAYRPAGELTPDATSGNITLTSTEDAFAPFAGNIVGREIHSSVDGGKATVTAYVSPTEVQAVVSRNFSSTNPITPGWWIITNPFFETANTVKTSSTGDCVQYTYDRNGDSTVDNNERFGFRLSGGAVYMHTGGTINCTSGSGSWEEITDGSSITIEELEFDDSDTVCLNMSDSPVSDCDPSSPGYAAPGTGDVLTWSRVLNITIAGRLKDDAAIARTVEQTVRLRNNVLYIN
jgi:type II secretory pathway component PulJ